MGCAASALPWRRRNDGDVHARRGRAGSVSRSSGGGGDGAAATPHQQRQQHPDGGRRSSSSNGAAATAAAALATSRNNRRMSDNDTVGQQASKDRSNRLTSAHLLQARRGNDNSNVSNSAYASPNAQAADKQAPRNITSATAAVAPMSPLRQSQQQQQQLQLPLPRSDDSVHDANSDMARASTPRSTSALQTMTLHDALLVISQQLAQRQRDGVSSVTKEEMERLVLVTRELESLKQVMRRSKYTVISTWSIVESENMLERLAQQLYDELLTHNPRLRVYFYGVDIEEQSRTLLRMLSTAVHFYDKPQAMVDMLMKAGARHRGYGVTRETFVSMQNAFLTVFPKFIGQDIYEAAEDEWKKFWKLILDLLEHGSCSAEGERYGRMYEEQNMKKLQSDFRMLLERQDHCDARHQFVGVMFGKAMELYRGDVSRPEAQAELRAGRQVVEAMLDTVRHFAGKEQAYASMRALGGRHAAHGLITRDSLQQLGEPFLFACRHFLEDEWNVAMESRFLALFQYMIDGVATGIEDDAVAAAPSATTTSPRNGTTAAAVVAASNGSNGNGKDSRAAKAAAAAAAAATASDEDDGENDEDSVKDAAVRGKSGGGTQDGRGNNNSNGNGRSSSNDGDTGAVATRTPVVGVGDHLSVASSGATFCLLFTDIEASTRLWQRNAEAMTAAVKEHQRVVRYLIAEYGAYEVKMIKDSFIVACKDVLVGAKLALAIQLELMRVAPIANGFRMVDNTEGRGDASVWDERTLRLRISLEHCTDAVATYDEKRNCYDYYGPSVNRCARILSVTCGGQILMSRQTFEKLMATPAFHDEPCAATLRDVQAPSPDVELDDNGLDHYVAVCDIGAVRLKGISEPVRLVSMVPRCFVGRLFVDKIGKLALRAAT